MLLLTANIFQPLIDVFEAVLKFFHGAGVSWGWSIVLLTVAVRAALIPLTIKQIGSMARMQALQPQMKAIQQKYKDDKQRQQQEMMKFYKENNFNPLGSCLPLVAQLPVFISLYYMLRQSLRLDICPAWQRAHNHGVLSSAHTVACGHHGAASFLFIGDITSTPTGLTLVALIVLYVGSQMASTLVMSATTVDPTQRRIMMFLPLVFVLFVIRFPSGLLVYWITTNLWTVGQQFVVRRRIGPLRAAHAAAVTGAAQDGGAPSTAPATAPVATRTASAGEGPNGGEAHPAAGGLSGLLRRAAAARQQEAPAGAANGGRSGPPPPPPRKKKKRSGRRR